VKDRRLVGWKARKLKTLIGHRLTQMLTVKKIKEKSKKILLSAMTSEL
jgi:hypothetical protein